MGVPQGFDAIDDLDPDELRQRLHSLQAVLARAPVPIAIAHDPECRFISANRALASLLHVSAGANVSLTPPPGQQPPYRIQHHGKDIPPEELPMQFAISHRTSVSNEIEIVLADGRTLYVQNDVEPLYDTHGNIYGCVSVVVDVTARKLAEMALRDADRRKDEFLATLSHELRNPLAPIKTALEVMRLGNDDPALIEKARATMERQLLHLVRITDDLLDVARITRNIVELRRSRIDLRAVLQSAIESTQPLLDARSQKLTVALPRKATWMHADFTRLSQVFSNLLNNASKYTEHGGHIELRVQSTDHAASVTVEDSGIGMPPEMLPRIFDMFTQLQEHRDRTHSGLGIGLTLARRLVELHEGTIEAASEGPGRGSRFTVRLPVVQATEMPPEPRSRETSARSQACRILVADDNPDAAEMMQLMLTLSGHDVHVAEDGIKAVEIARVFNPDIAFLDIGMPRMDGFEAARHIRELGGRTVLVALTGWGQDEDKQRSREAGFHHHLTKPPDREVLERLIAECRATPE
jgi:signal transduction histidine kinase/CheY-like chemotaxis protein